MIPTKEVRFSPRPRLPTVGAHVDVVYLAGDEHLDAHASRASRQLGQLHGAEVLAFRDAPQRVDGDAHRVGHRSPRAVALRISADGERADRTIVNAKIGAS